MPVLRNQRHEQFCQLVAGGMTGTAAYVEVGFTPNPGNAARLICRPQVRARIEEIKARGAARAEVTVERTVRELADMAFYDPGEIGAANIKGPEDIQHLPEPLRRAICGWSWDRQGNFVLKLANKDGALDKIGRYLGMYRDKVEHSGGVTITIGEADAGL